VIQGRFLFAVYSFALDIAAPGMESTVSRWS